MHAILQEHYVIKTSYTRAHATTVLCNNLKRMLQRYSQETRIREMIAS